MSSPGAKYPVVEKTRPTFYFIGVTTGKSSIMKVFPHWAAAWSRPEVVMEGVDLKLHDDPEAYRRVVAQIKNDPLSLGALVTTHKMDLYNSARDMFEYLDPYATLCGELSSISKLDGRLEGHAMDPITAGLSLDTLLGKGYFDRTKGDVLCFGAGGSAVAISLHFINKRNKADRPRRIVVVNRSQPRLDHLQEMVQGQKTDICFECLCNEDPQRNDALMAEMAEGSIVINATGMGKDRPGSPVTEAGLFPAGGIAWELNYRGELDFMRQALRQIDSRRVRVEDGWTYFLHGWTQVIKQVLHLPLPPKLFERLAAIAQTLR